MFVIYKSTVGEINVENERCKICSKQPEFAKINKKLAKGHTLKGWEYQGRKSRTYDCPSSVATLPWSQWQFEKTNWFLLSVGLENQSVHLGAYGCSWAECLCPVLRVHSPTQQWTGEERCIQLLLFHPPLSPMSAFSPPTLLSQRTAVQETGGMWEI